VNFAAGIIRRHRISIGSLWRKLNPGQQALLVLACLRKGEAFASLAAGFGVGTATAWRYVEETVDRVAADRPFYSGRHKKHGMGRRAGHPRRQGRPGEHVREDPVQGEEQAGFPETGQQGAREAPRTR